MPLIFTYKPPFFPPTALFYQQKMRHREANMSPLGCQASPLQNLVENRVWGFFCRLEPENEVLHKKLK